MKHILASVMLVGLVMCTPLRARAEGSAQVGTNQRLQSSTSIRVDIIDFANETITWTGQGTAAIRSPSNTLMATLNSGQSYQPTVAGTFSVSLSSSQTGVWDIAVSNTRAGFGRVHARQWDYNTGSFAQSAASSASYYALVPGGSSATDGVVELRLNGLSGNVYSIGANRTGVDGANAGRSVPSSGNGFTASFEMYLLPPEIGRYNPITPVISNFAYGSGAQGCGLITAGSSGTFTFTTNVEATYNLVCDLNGDGVFNRVASTDLLLVGLTVNGSNSVVWNGKNNAGDDVSAGEYDCKVFVGTGELHFVGSDIETSYAGLQLFAVDAALARTGLNMFWNDTAVQGNDVNMPAPTSTTGTPTSGANGVNSGSYASAAAANTTAHSWGNFSSASKGNNALIDTFASVVSSASTALGVEAIAVSQDSDSDGLSDYLEICMLGTNPNRADSDGDTVSDFVETNGGSPINTDGSAGIDALDTDSDDDGVEDGVDTNRTSTSQCRDLDADGCDDCSVVHTGGGSVSDDGPDADQDGICNGSDSDDDGDGVPDSSDSAPLDPSECTDSDSDGCDDCAIVHTGGGSVSNDGADSDMDGVCDLGDLDDDNDGVPDASDAAPLNSSVCRDVDADGCDDCAIVHTGGGSVSHDGPDADMDGACNMLDPDDDGDGVEDGNDSAPLDPTLCRDVDADGCDDCAVVHTGGGSVSDDGTDSDMDGQCDLGDSDDDGDGVADSGDVAANDNTRCRDADGDGCDDCAVVHTGGGATSNDGTDTDMDGKCDAGDSDDDNDGVLDGSDSAPTDAHVCRDSDADTCDDCAVTGADGSGGDPSNDGADFNHDGTCDAAGADADGDGVPDHEDLDIDGDGIPNSQEGDGDQDGDGLDNAYDLDSDGDGIPDLIEAGGADEDGDGKVDDAQDADKDGLDDGVANTPLSRPDTDDDGLPDFLDLDSDGDGASDLAEAGGGELDADHDGRVDDERDDNGNGWSDVVDNSPDLPERGEPLPIPDTDGDGSFDFRDVDSDDDGVPDAVEAHDSDHDGQSDVEPGEDEDGDGWADGYKPSATPPDRDADGLPDYRDVDDDDDGRSTRDELRDQDEHGPDVDGDGVPNYLDDNSDGDGVSDRDENQSTGDVDDNGVPDYLEPNVYPEDRDGDGVLDYKERTTYSGDSLDTDGDGTPDADDDDDDGDGIPTRDERVNGEDTDSDGDGTPDYLDADDDNDGIPTLVENGPGVGGTDIDGDGIPNYLDEDSDGDGLRDAEEGLRDLDHNGVPDYRERPRGGYAGGAGCVVSGRGGEGHAPLMLVLGLWLIARKRRSKA